MVYSVADQMRDQIIMSYLNYTYGNQITSFVLNNFYVQSNNRPME